MKLLGPLIVACAVASVSLGATRSQTFDSDPGWTGLNNRVEVKQYPTVTQDFGYSKTNHAGASVGEMGGMVTRAATPAFYGDKVGSLTLDDRMSASGTFAFTKTSAGAGVFVGFFQEHQPGASGRPIGSLGMDFDTEGGGARLAVRLITGRNQSCGTFVTPYVPGKFRPTPIRNDGTRYKWTLDYDPAGAGGRGRFTFTMQGDQPKPGSLVGANSPAVAKDEARIRFPDTTTFSVDLPEGFKQQGTTFTHFGMMNMMKPGGRLAIFLDDLKYQDRAQDFSSDPNWNAAGNRATYQATDVGGAHNFGYSGDTNHAGGAKQGEIGGTFWRTDKWGYYAERIEPVTFDHRLEARGKVAMVVGGVDADMCFGWFRSAGSGEGEDRAPNRTGEFVGIKVGGPTRVGHMFLPTFTVNEKLRGLPDHGPVMRPGKACEWSLVYDPDANNGQGAITATLDGESVTHNLKPGQKAKAKDARLDHFGMFAIGPGGQIVKLYLDDITYTAGGAK
jgi:hypothetical protein